MLPDDKCMHLQVFRTLLDEEEPFLKVFETERWEMFTIENILERNVKARCDSPCRYLPLGRWWMHQAILRKTAQ